MIKKILGYLIMFSAAVSLSDEDVLAALLLLLTSVSLLLTDSHFNEFLARRFGKDKIPTFPNPAHYAATFLLLGISGNYITPQNATLAVQNSVEELNSQKRRDQISETSCVNGFLENADLLWTNLNTYRFEEAFYRYGYSTGDYADWESSRTALQNEWESCNETIDPIEKPYFQSVLIAVSSMYPVGMTWYQNEGRNDNASEENIAYISRILNYDWETKEVL